MERGESLVDDTAVCTDDDSWEGYVGDGSEAVIVAEEDWGPLPLLVSVLDVIGAHQHADDQHSSPNAPKTLSRLDNIFLGNLYGETCL